MIIYGYKCLSVDNVIKASLKNSWFALHIKTLQQVHYIQVNSLKSESLGKLLKYTQPKKSIPTNPLNVRSYVLKVGNCILVYKFSLLSLKTGHN